MAITVNQVMDELTKHTEVEGTVDKLLFGNAEQEVTGIAVSFMASQDVIERAIALGANLLIAHESPYYSHAAPLEELASCPVYRRKLHLIEESEIAIFRYHDYWHRYRSDGIMMGLIQALNWEADVIKYESVSAVVALPQMTAYEVALYLKTKLNLPYVRIAGDSSAVCKRAGVVVGYRGGGRTAIPLFTSDQVDLIIAGEGPEWETPEYVRDASHQEAGKALIMLGHAESEEPGMNYLAQQLSMAYPSTPVHFIGGKPIFSVI